MDEKMDQISRTIAAIDAWLSSPADIGHSSRSQPRRSHSIKSRSITKGKRHPSCSHPDLCARSRAEDRTFSPFAAGPEPSHLDLCARSRAEETTGPSRERQGRG